jgi:ankyrin repeat protein
LILLIDLSVVCKFSLKFSLLQGGESGWSSLHRALHFGHLCIAGVLLQFGASLALEDTRGRTPVDLISCPVSQANGDFPDAGSFLLPQEMVLLYRALGNLACFMEVIFHFSFNGSLQLGKWDKLSAGNWQRPHTKTTMQSRSFAWIIYQKQLLHQSFTV